MKSTKNKDTGQMLSKSTEEHKTVLTHKTLNMDPRQDFFLCIRPYLEEMYAA